VKSRFILGLLALLCFATPGNAVNSGPKALTPTFSLENPPSAADWRFMQHAGAGEITELWAFHKGQGKALKDWAWQWRIGWLKVCGRVKSTCCDEILQQGMGDRAMVVRAEAAASFGERYAGTREKSVMDKLVRAYKDPKNVRNGKPLLVLYRILFALNQIGGAQSDTVGKKLAIGYSQTSNYWTILSNNRLQKL
jgi:hypothetical protein